MVLCISTLCHDKEYLDGVLRWKVCRHKRSLEFVGVGQGWEDIFHLP